MMNGVGGDRRAFRHETTHATQMIEVVVGVDEVADRLAGEELVDSTALVR
jgi:hypothetical protein